MEKTRFSVDSGSFIIIDPCYLPRFMEYFDMDKLAKSKNGKDYIKTVVRKAFPDYNYAKVAYSEGFGGDGIFEITVNLPDSNNKIGSIKAI